MLIHFQIQGLKILERKLKAAQDMMRSLKPYWQSVGSYIQRQTINERFEKEQSPTGEKWKPLSERTKAIRRKKHKSGNMKILQDNGELRRSITYEAGTNYVRIGSVLKYARIHQFGGTVEVSRVGQYKRDYKNHRFKRKWNSYSYSHKITIPARPFLGITAAECEHIKSMLKNYILLRLKGGA